MSLLLEGLASPLFLLPNSIRRRLLENHIWILSASKDPNSPYQHGIETMEKHRCIFFHVPKCAGMSVAKALFGNRGILHISPLHAKLIFGSANFSAYYKFCFVRNPFDRVVSAFHYMKEGALDHWESPWIKQHISPYETFSDFVLSELHKREVINETLFRPQIKYICDSRGTILMDYCGRYEFLERDLNVIINKLRISADLPKTNTSSHDPNYRNYYRNNSVIKKVKELYKKDLEILNYDF